MPDRLLVKLVVVLLFVLALGLFRVARDFYSSTRFTSKTKILITAGIVAALYGGFVVYPEESAFYKAKREAASDPWALVGFRDSHPSSRRMGEVDDLLWQATSGPKGDWALYLYKEHFGYDGKHKEELK